MVSKIKVLSIRQPHAANIVYGGKWCENRTWNTRYRGRLYIHASQTHDGGTCEQDYPQVRGAIIGVCDLVDCIPLELTFDFRYLVKVLRPKLNLSTLIGAAVIHSADEYCHGPHCLILANRRSLRRPVGMSGKLGIFTATVRESLLDVL